MFDLTSSKMLLLAVIALLVVGPKDLPQLLRAIGRYVGMVKRQAAEFRTQFDDAMRESELAEIKKQVTEFSREAESAVREAETALNKEVAAVETEANKTLSDIDRVASGEAEAHAKSVSEAMPVEPHLPATLEQPSPAPLSSAGSVSASGDAPTPAMPAVVPAPAASAAGHPKTHERV